MTRPGDQPTANLLVTMTGKASAAKAATGDKPVFAYIPGLPQPQRAIAERIDALAAKSLPGLQRAVKRGMAYYGVDGGWCFLRHLRRPREADVHTGYGTPAEPPVTPNRNGQIHPRSRVRFT